MEKVITIDGRPIKFKSTGAYLLRYKAQFGRDAIQDMLKLEQIVDANGNFNFKALDLEVVYNLIWTLAKTADPDIPPPFEWLDSFDEFPLVDIVPEINELIFSCINTNVKSKKK